MGRFVELFPLGMAIRVGGGLAVLWGLRRKQMHKFKMALLLGGAFVVAAGTPSLAAPLTGTWASAKEGAMEGVLVTAKKDGSTMSVTVVSDEKGRYAFPEGRRTPGHYNLKVRAIGYILDGPRAVDVGAAATTADIKLNTTPN